MPSIKTISHVQATAEAGVFDVTGIVIDDAEAEIELSTCVRPDDPYGLNPVIRSWMADHAGEFAIEPYTPPDPPTDEEVRARMPALTRRQLKLALLENGITSDQVAATIGAMPEGMAKEVAKIEWADATTFERLHPLIASIGGTLGLTEPQIDAMWTAASAL